ncbi:MAG: hypothetical protein HY614_00815, partial [Candidatus Rokubacteria bacterium]|nr:hypothetical protein [Candidatus Rokubacteria bacterium]
MRRFLAVLVSVLAIVGLVAPQAFAQAPAPKVTINGLVDFVTSAYNNATGDSPRDITDGGKDAGWYSR